MKISAHLAGESKVVVASGPREVVLVDLMSFLIRNAHGETEWVNKVSRWADKTKKGYLKITLYDDTVDQFWID